MNCHPERNRRWSEGPALPFVQYRREAPLNQSELLGSEKAQKAATRNPKAARWQ
jgi:hypothetical protein